MDLMDSWLVARKMVALLLGLEPARALQPDHLHYQGVTTKLRNPDAHHH
jgi:hypothetical protein